MEKHKNFLVDHPSLDCSRSNSFNFGVPMNFEASEVSKGLVVNGGEHVYIRHITFSLLIDVRCCRPSMEQIYPLKFLAFCWVLGWKRSKQSLWEEPINMQLENEFIEIINIILFSYNKFGMQL